MENKIIIIILTIILFIIIILNHVIIVTDPKKEQTDKSDCSQTTFGCCPDGVNSKINFYGTNCPKYNPGPGYYPQPYIKPVGGCAGTRYGCCPDNYTPKFDSQGSNCHI